MSSKADFGQAIVFLAEKAGLSQKQLAKALSVHPKTISAWNKGERKPGRRALDTLRDELGLTKAEIDAVAAFHAEWRQAMEKKKHRTAGEVHEAPARYQAETDEWHLELGRAVAKMLDLLELGPLGHPGR